MEVGRRVQIDQILRPVDARGSPGRQSSPALSSPAYRSRLHRRSERREGYCRGSAPYPEPSLRDPPKDDGRRGGISSPGHRDGCPRTPGRAKAKPLRGRLRRALTQPENPGQGQACPTEEIPPATSAGVNPEEPTHPYSHPYSQGRRPTPTQPDSDRRASQGRSRMTSHPRSSSNPQAGRGRRRRRRRRRRRLTIAIETRPVGRSTLSPSGEAGRSDDCPTRRSASSFPDLILTDGTQLLFI